MNPDENLVFFSAEEGPLLHADSLKGFEDPESMGALHQNDCVSGAKDDFPELLSKVVIKIHRHFAMLHDKHLLKIPDLAHKWMMIMGRFIESRLMGKETELKRGFRPRKKMGGFDAGSRPNDLGKYLAVFLDPFRLFHRICGATLLGKSPRVLGNTARTPLFAFLRPR